MNNNQLLIRECIQKCFTVLDRYDRALKAYGTEKAEITAQPWSDREKARRYDAAAEKLQGSALQCYDDIFKELATVRKTAVRMEQAFDIGPELQASINLVTAVGEKLPWDTRLNIVRSFAGSKQALIALEALFKSQGVDTKEVAHYIFDADSRCDRLDLTAHRLTVQPGSDFGITVRVAKEFEDFAELEGVELPDKFVSENKAEYLNARMRESMGLPVA